MSNGSVTSINNTSSLACGSAAFQLGYLARNSAGGGPRLWTMAPAPKLLQHGRQAWDVALKLGDHTPMKGEASLHSFFWAGNLWNKEPKWPCVLNCNHWPFHSLVKHSMFAFYASGSSPSSTYMEKAGASSSKIQQRSPLYTPTYGH